MWITGNNWVPVTPKGIRSPVWQWIMALTSGRDAVDFRMNEPLLKARGRVGLNGLGVIVVLDDVGGGHLAGRQASREKEMLRIHIVADADVAIGVQHSFIGQNVIGQHQIADDVTVG